jgi:outer membrane protein assembly factor BamD
MCRNITLAALLAGLVLASCSGNKKVSMYPEDRLAMADSLRSQDKCSKAVVEYEQLLSEFPTQQVAEQAQYNLARCHMALGEHELAIQEFEDFVDSYVRSDLVDNALYMIALSYIEQSPRAERDQTKTTKALSELHLLLREYPDTDVRDEAEEAIAACRSKLAEKEYLSGRLYLRLRHWNPARIYFDSVLQEYPDTPWAAPALLGKALAYVGEKRLNKARETFEQVVSDYPESDVGREAAKRLKELGGAIEREPRTSSGE